MSDDIKRALLDRKRLPRDFVDVPDVGKVEVRGLTRDEQLAMARLEGDARERYVLSRGLEPVDITTEEEAQAYRENAAADEVSNVILKIMDLTNPRPKEVYEEFEANPDLEFRAPAGGEAGDDGAASAGGDER